jgi:short-subunit dehydrogenase
VGPERIGDQAIEDLQVGPELTCRWGQNSPAKPIYAFANGMVNAPYAASKAAVEQLGRALRAELAGRGATAGVLYPGWVATPIAAAAFGEDPLATRLVELAFPGPLRRPILPEKVAAAAVRGIERRARSTIVPARWAPLSALRGLVNPLIDRDLERRPEFRDLVRKMENRVAGS